MTLSGVSGGECVGADLGAQLAAGSVIDVGTVTITQSGSDVAAVVRSSSTGLTCRYEGTVALAAFAVNDSSCDVKEILYQCSNGASRVLELVGSTITGTISGDTATGVVATSYNVFSEHTEEAQRRPVAGLIVQQQFAAAR